MHQLHGRFLLVGIILCLCCLWTVCTTSDGSEEVNVIAILVDCR